ncbi:unnamed protein product [Prunus armeniaca]
MTSASRRTRMGWNPAASGCHVAVTSRRRPALPQTFIRYFRQLRRRNPSIQIDFRVRVWPILGSQFRPLLSFPVIGIDQATHVLPARVAARGQ